MKLSKSFSTEDFKKFGDMEIEKDLTTFWANRKKRKKVYSLSHFVLDRNLNFFEGKALIYKS